MYASAYQMIDSTAQVFAGMIVLTSILAIGMLLCSLCMIWAYMNSAKQPVQADFMPRYVTWNAQDLPPGAPSALHQHATGTENHHDIEGSTVYY
ncbi:hypothetical protein DdX_20483 [Ditylenchus destructor]|uniref:Uncharacterized protein n=1 Tax=Ditylenchus destructor TaxID=166010 RepID=A0AAD4QWC1_9BILA|nr:hypothetical protein DdX_20483 [Ditylenchus destructor]